MQIPPHSTKTKQNKKAINAWWVITSVWIKRKKKKNMLLTAELHVASLIEVKISYWARVLLCCISTWLWGPTHSLTIGYSSICHGPLRRSPLPSLQSHYHRRAASILKHPTHPLHELFILFTFSDRRYRSVKCKTCRLKSSFFPIATKLLNRWQEL